MCGSSEGMMKASKDSASIRLRRAAIVSLLAAIAASLVMASDAMARRAVVDFFRTLRVSVATGVVYRASLEVSVVWWVLGDDDLLSVHRRWRVAFEGVRRASKLFMDEALTNMGDVTIRESVKGSRWWKFSDVFSDKLRFSEKGAERSVFHPDGFPRL